MLSDDDTWEPMSNLDCPEIISLYEKKKKSAMVVSEPKKEQKETAKRPSEEAIVTKKKIPKKVCSKIFFEFSHGLKDEVFYPLS